ncbi:hypothetical protein KQI84_14390 [bacterium]|nr:hypothetical protein [bacterium]
MDFQTLKQDYDEQQEEFRDLVVDATNLLLAKALDRISEEGEERLEDLLDQMRTIEKEQVRILPVLIKEKKRELDTIQKNFDDGTEDWLETMLSSMGVEEDLNEMLCRFAELRAGQEVTPPHL